MTDNGSAYRSHHWGQACGGLALRHLRTRPYSPRTNGKAERFIQTSLREWARACPRAGASRTRGRARLRARPSAPPRSSPGSSITTPPGRMPPWPTSRPPPVCSHRRSSVRPRAPFLRSDLRSPTTGPPGRRQERRRRPAPAGAKRPCADPPDRSRSNRRAPNAQSPEQRSWKRHLGLQRPGHVVLTLEDGTVRLSTMRQELERVRELARPYAPKDRLASDELIAERRAAARKE